MKWEKLLSHGCPLPPTLRDFQADFIDLVISGNSVVLKVPTGAGKTLPMVLVNSFTEGQY